MLRQPFESKRYASQQYHRALATAGVTASMRRTGDCYDTAVAESSFAPLKKELIHRYRYLDRRDASRAIAECIEMLYNNQRLHSSSCYQSPAEFAAFNANPQAPKIAV